MVVCAPNAWHAGEEGGGGTDQEAKEGAPHEQRAVPSHGMQKYGEGGETPNQERERSGGNPQSGEHASCAWPDTRNGGEGGKTCIGPPPLVKSGGRGTQSNNKRHRAPERAHLLH